MLPSGVPRLTTDSAVGVFPGVWRPLFFKTPFPGWSSVPISFVSLFIFYIFSYLLSKTMGCFSGCLMSSAGIQKLFCGIYSAFKCSFDESVGEKLVSPSYSSSILGLHPMSSSNCCFLNCIQISQEAGQVAWYSHLLKNFPQFVVMHTVQGFGIVNKAEVDVFLELSCFFHDPADVGNLISGSSAFSKTSLNIWKFMVHILLKSGLENFEHYFTSM